MLKFFLKNKYFKLNKSKMNKSNPKGSLHQKEIQTIFSSFQISFGKNYISAERFKSQLELYKLKLYKKV